MPMPPTPTGGPSPIILQPTTAAAAGSRVCARRELRPARQVGVPGRLVGGRLAPLDEVRPAVGRRGDDHVGTARAAARLGVKAGEDLGGAEVERLDLNAAIALLEP